MNLVISGEAICEVVFVKEVNEMIAKCGMACNRCPWSYAVREGLQTEEEYESFRKKCKEALGYSPTTNVYQNCVGCQTPDEDIPQGARIPLRNCLVRKCVDALNIENCAYCSRFPCGYIQWKGTQWSRENIEAKRGNLSEEDYKTFVEPFEGLDHLMAIRETISPVQIVEAITVPSLSLKIIDFPEDISLPDTEKKKFRELHTLLSSIRQSNLGIEDTDIYAQQQRLKNRITVFFRFLWICGRYGKYEKHQIKVDSGEYMNNRGSEKVLSDWNFVKGVIFEVLSDFGIHCTSEVSADNGSQGAETPGGYLRKKGWYMIIWPDESKKGILETLHRYANFLEKTYGKKAFMHFKTVDMQKLSE
jgi:hypothetical protein